MHRHFSSELEPPLAKSPECAEGEDFQIFLSFQDTYFSAFWRLHPNEAILDSTAVEAGHQAVYVSLGKPKVYNQVSF